LANTIKYLEKKSPNSKLAINIVLYEKTQKLNIENEMLDKENEMLDKENEILDRKNEILEKQNKMLELLTSR
jgi:hypothetical protein